MKANSGETAKDFCSNKMIQTCWYKGVGLDRAVRYETMQFYKASCILSVILSAEVVLYNCKKKDSPASHQPIKTMLTKKT